MRLRLRRQLVRSSIAACALASVATAAAAQGTQRATLMPTGLFGTGVIDSELGLTGGVGAALASQRYVVRALADLHVVQPDDAGHSWAVGSDGPECRDDQTGAAVDPSFCGIDRVLSGVSTDASLIIPAARGGVHLGAGYRFGSGSTPYVLAGYGFDPTRGEWNLLLRLLAGGNLLALQAVATVPIRRP